MHENRNVEAMLHVNQQLEHQKHFKIYLVRHCNQRGSCQKQMQC
jgi:hypothetical protein